MPSRGRSPFIAGCLISCAVFSGCTTEQGTGKTAAIPWLTPTDVPGSRRDLKNATKLDLTYAQWQEQIGNLPAAEESYRRVLQENPDSVDAMIGLARLEQLSGRKDSAEKAYLTAVRAAPRSAQALDALGQFYASEERWGDAAAAHGQATQADPDNAVLRQHYAVALARSGKPGESLAHFKKAVGEAEGHYNLGFILYEQGHPQLAQQQFLQAITLRPDLEAAQTMLDELRRGGEDATMLALDASARRQPVLQTAAVEPAATQAPPATGLTAADGYQPPQWRMPAQEGKSPQAEQMRNQVAAPAGP